MAQPEPTVPTRSRRRGWLTAALALVAFAVALALLIGTRRPVASEITITAGYPRTTRMLIAGVLATQLQAHGINARIIESRNTTDELERVNSGEVDFALVSGAFRHRGFPHVREVAPLFPEALHLLVKAELADHGSAGLAVLRGRSVDLGPADSATADLAAAVLEFAGIACEPAGAKDVCRPTNLELDALAQRAEKGPRDALPDAIFHLASVPSAIAMQLVRTRGYTLVSLPFARAFRLSEMIRGSSEPPGAGEIERRYTEGVEIAEFSYQIEPPIPSEALATIGARLLLVANEDVSPATVEGVLETIFESHFARIPHPPLDKKLLDLPPRHPLHAGALAFVARDRPWLSGNDAERIANTLSIVGALVGGGLFLWQALRQRLSARRDDLFAKYQLQIAALESRVVEHELAADLALDPLITLQRELLGLKSEALGRYAAGELGSRATLTDLLVPLNAARDHVAQLLLHVRDNVEEQAESEGREAQEVWEEAVERSEETSKS